MERPKECFKTSVGGQALMEGIMMRGPEKICVAVRRPDGTLDMTYENVKHHRWQKIPLVRGAAAMIENLRAGLPLPDALRRGEHAEEAGEEPGRFETWLGEHAGPGVQNFFMALAAVCGGLLAIVLFMVLPTAIVGFCRPLRASGLGQGGAGGARSRSPSSWATSSSAPHEGDPPGVRVPRRRA